MTKIQNTLGSKFDFDKLSYKTDKWAVINNGVNGDNDYISIINNNKI